MDRESARQEIRRQIRCENYLEKSKGNLYCCPFCGSGTKANKTGALKVYPETNTWYCHACQKSGDVIDLYQQATGADYNTALSLLAQEIGITIDPYRPAAEKDFIPDGGNKPTERPERPQGDFNGQGGINTPSGAKAPENGEKTPQEANADNTEYYRECRERLKDPAAAAYLRKRGISLETAAAYWVGYNPKADPAGAGHPCPRIIIPCSKGHYIGRRIDGKKEYAKLNNTGSNPAIFNSRVLYKQEVQEIFVVEGAFDALSILEAGYTAIALNSAANMQTLIKQLEQRRTGATLILCPDNDKDEKTREAVQKRFAELAAGLQRLNISHITANICRADTQLYKDANEALTGDKTAFLKALERAKHQAGTRPDNTKYYIDELMAGEIERFKSDKKTGFTNLDEKADGLYTGLYVLAAISSLGKTSFCLQLADQLAEKGNDVIFFSLEQSRLELVSKSIARRTVKRDDSGNLQLKDAVTSLSIRKGALTEALEAAKEYREAVGDRISIVEGNFSCDIPFIGDYIRQYIRRTGTRPVVFIDYLQILQPPDAGRRQSTKEIVDSTVTALKRISRELNLTIIVISSVNRANYLTPIDFESLKESGNIEYSCDVLWGLQLQCLHDPEFDKGDKGDKLQQRKAVNDAKTATPRKIELSCLKNRYGKANYSCYFDYYPANDLFIESGCEEFPAPTSTPKAGRKL